MGGKQDEAGRIIKPNASQRRAIELALTQPVSFIKGPPGTGKTDTILELISCIVHQKNGWGEPRAVAVVSSNHSAIKTVHDKVEKAEKSREKRGKKPGPGRKEPPGARAPGPVRMSPA